MSNSTQQTEYLLNRVIFYAKRRLKISCRVSVFLLVFATLNVNADEIFFNISKQFNARILVNDKDNKSGKGFGGKQNIKCLNPTLSENGIMQASNYIDFKISDINKDNAILIPLNGAVEIPLYGSPELTSLAFAYTSSGYDMSGSGKGKITVVYSDGTSQDFPWADPGKSGIVNCGLTIFTQTGVSTAGTFIKYIADKDKETDSLRFYSRLLNRLNSDKAVAKIIFDTHGFIDPGNDAEWAIFAITGNGEITKTSDLAQVNPGTRPYEMTWAKRNRDEYPPFVDFQNVSGWKKSGSAKIYFNSTTERPLFLPKSARLELYTNALGSVLLSPPNPLKLPTDFNAASLWIHGDGFGDGYLVYLQTQNNRLIVTALFSYTGSTGKTEQLELPFFVIRHGQWFQLHHQFSPDELAKLRNNAYFTGFKITGFGANENRVIYMANFSIFKDPFKPLNFAPQPQRGVEPLPGADPGINIGKGRLPFPTREKTILPLNFTENFKNNSNYDGTTAVFTYDGNDCRISYTYTPSRGSFDDIECRLVYPDGKSVTFKPAIGGGIFSGNKEKEVSSARLLHCALENDELTAVWEMTFKDSSPIVVIYRFRIWQKSLVMDVLSEGGDVSKINYGKNVGLENPRLINTPYYTYNIYSNDRPAIVVAGDVEHPLFFSENTDWYLSNSSALYASNSITKEGVTSNGGTIYRSKTDGKRNNCAERLFFTVSPIYDEVLPTVANPASPYRHVGYGSMWMMFGYSTPDGLYPYWRKGFRKMIINDHEILFRDKEESFTFRTKVAPLKGGEAARKNSEYLQKTLGYIYGPYTQYCDIGATNEYFKIDNILRNPDTQLRHGWFHSYTAKPVWAQEMSAKLPPILKKKFGYNTSYCDGHTCVAPWDMVDYDNRSPGAATFAQTFYSYGQIFMNEKTAWDGPVYSEGNYHSFYAGLSDGDYAQDKSYKLPFNPWLVNYDLRNMHNLSACLGMGDMYQFMNGSNFDFKKDKAATSFAIDRLIAGTLAFGHAALMPKSVAFLMSAPRTYFMAVPVTRLYGLSPIKSIQYFDGNGNWQDASKAIMDRSYVNSQLLVRYENGTVVIVNGSPGDRSLQVNIDGHDLDLSQNGYAAWSGDGKTSVISTNDKYGNHYDYAVTPEHIYIDGRGKMIQQELAVANGPAVLLILGNGEFEYIPFNDGFYADYNITGETVAAGFKLKIDSVTALDYKKNSLPDKVEVRVSRGYSWIMPAPQAYSYLIKGKLAEPTAILTSESTVVFPEETVTVRDVNGKKWQIEIPLTRGKTDLFWWQFDQNWIDFKIVEPFQIKTMIEGKNLIVAVRSFLPGPAKTSLAVNGITQEFTLSPDRTEQLKFALPEKAGEHNLSIICRSEKLENTITCQIQAKEEPLLYSKLTDKNVIFGIMSQSSKPKSLSGADIAIKNAFTTKESADFGETGAMIVPMNCRCGNIEKTDSFGLQVPYKEDTGSVYLKYENIMIPSEGNPFLQTSAGKRNNAANNLRYTFTLTDQNDKKHTLADFRVKNNEWVDFSTSLKAWAGQKVTLTFSCYADADPANGWGALTYPEIRDRRKTINYEIK